MNPSNRTDIDSIETLRLRLRAFIAERDWEQFHSPKNLAMALIVEAGELVEHFQWLTAEQADRLPPETLAEVEQELADVFIFLVELADRLKIDLLAAAGRKLTLNAQKYPVEKSRGLATKYNKL
jgi:NTP pyrophosphatase (non-canonical NTP hydrolase)